MKEQNKSNKPVITLSNSLELLIDSISFTIKLNLSKKRIRITNNTTGDEVVFSDKQAYSLDLDIVRLKNYPDNVWTVKDWGLTFLVSNEFQIMNFQIYLGEVDAFDSNLVVGFCLPNFNE